MKGRVEGLPEDLEQVVRRYGGARLLRKAYEESLSRVKELQRVAGGCLGGVGLVWNASNQVVLLRHDPETGWGTGWATPGGMAEPGETPEETFFREVREETGLRVTRILDLTYVFDMTVTSGKESVHGYVFQFEALAKDGRLAPGEGILEARWFDHLPKDMIYRTEYIEAFAARLRRPPKDRFSL